MAPRSCNTANSMRDFVFPDGKRPFLEEEHTSPRQTPGNTTSEPRGATTTSLSASSSFNSMEAFAGSNATSLDSSHQDVPDLEAKDADISTMNYEQSQDNAVEHLQRTRPFEGIRHEGGMYSIKASETDTSDTIYDPILKRFGLNRPHIGPRSFEVHSQPSPRSSLSSLDSLPSLLTDNLEKFFYSVLPKLSLPPSPVVACVFNGVKTSSSDDEIEQGPLSTPCS